MIVVYFGEVLSLSFSWLCDQIMKEIQENDVSIYHFPTDDETTKDVNEQMDVSGVHH